MPYSFFVIYYVEVIFFMQYKQIVKWISIWSFNVIYGCKIDSLDTF